jgi:L-fucose isomerase-like protein
LDDLVAVAAQFATPGAVDLTPAEFARRCEKAYRGTFPPAGETKCADDSPKLTGIGECVARFRKSKVLVLGQGNGGRQRDVLGATWQYVDWKELEATYPEIDPDEATEWASRWTRRAEALPAGEYIEPSVPSAEEIHNAALVYLAMCRLLKKHDTDMITANCGGGLGTSGALRGFPCLGFAQLLDDGGLGICEAHVDDTPPMLMARLLSGRPGFVSDPAIDTSQNRIVYSHCVGPTKVFGPGGEQNGFHIRTSHARLGAVVESLMPAGYMTTSFRTNVARRQMIIHQAKSLGPLASEKGCRTKLIGEVHGDIGKLFDRWSQFGWHRVTVYGDVKEPLAEFGRALGLNVIEEA